MGTYKKAIITDAGEALRARAIAGEVSMQFSHAKTSAYVYPEGTDLTKLTDLQEIKQTVVPSNVQVNNDTLISVRSLFGNEQIAEEYLIQNVGLYATDGENEILFAVCQATMPDQMPVYDGVAPSSFIYNIQLTVSQASQIALTVNTAGTATTQDILELEHNKLDAEGGDISETVITSAEESTVEYPVPAAGDSAKMILGKTRKFFTDIKNWMTGVCLLGQIVNNCVTDNANLPLSAAQGKVLMDYYTKLYSDLDNSILTNAKITGSVPERKLLVRKDVGGGSNDFIQLYATESGLEFGNQKAGTWNRIWQSALTSDFTWKLLGTIELNEAGRENKKILSYASIADRCNELYIGYGQKNVDQDYGGGVIIINKGHNKPAFVPLWINSSSYIVAYIYNETSKKQIETFISSTSFSTCLFKVYWR